MKSLTDCMRSYLVEQGVVRLPNQAGSLPTCWAELLEGAPSPDELKGVAASTTTVHLGIAPGPPTASFEGFLDDTMVEIVVRSTKAAQREGEDTLKLIREALNDKRNFDMGGLDISEVLQWRGAARVPAALVGEGFAWEMAYRVVLRSDSYHE